MERYARHIVYHKWMDADIFRPFVSFDTLKEAVAFCDEQEGRKVLKLIDLEHLDMGDMLVADECSELIARFRAERN